MRKHLVWLALCAGFGLSACTTFQASRQAPAKACANWRRIAILSPSEEVCPEIPGWKRKDQLFASTLRAYQERRGYDQQKSLGAQRDPAQLSTEEVVQELARFCVYENQDKKVRDRPFPERAELVKVDKDCAAIERTADLNLSGIPEEDWEPLADNFLSQAGQASSLAIENRLGVRLAFLDTQPTGMGVSTAPGNSHHGYTLTHIARHLVCSRSPVTGSDHCAAQITTRLALPLVRFKAKSRAGTRTDFVRGGYLGTQKDLAEAITSEVDTWLQGSQEHLVINLSVGWDGQLFGDLDADQIDELNLGAQAVYRALQYAASQNVLVLAAAGNRKDCPGSTPGPLLPAAWEKGVFNEKATPLLYAVGGVNSYEKPLDNARPGGMPKRVAYGEIAGVASWDPKYYTAFYTGSSIATAVASSIAAIVWDSFPDLSRQEVMEILDQSGNELFPANFWFGSDAPPTAATVVPKARRLSLCAALDLACRKHTGQPCPLRSSCGERTPTHTIFPKWASVLSGKKTCHPWMHPQPEDPPCLNCHEPPPTR